LSRVSEGLTSALPSDLLAQDIREVLHYLGEITGEVTTDEILGNIFKNFCIGK
jgi:tRNA modification GTPase